MTVFDIAILIIACTFTLLCAWRGFFWTVLKFGAWVLAIILSRLFGVMLGELFFRDSALATVLGTAIAFALLMTGLGLAARILAKAMVKVLIGKTLDRVLGALLGLTVAIGIACLMACVVDTADLLVPSLNLRSAAEDSIIFKYFL